MKDKHVESRIKGVVAKEQDNDQAMVADNIVVNLAMVLIEEGGLHEMTIIIQLMIHY